MTLKTRTLSHYLEAKQTEEDDKTQFDEAAEKVKMLTKKPNDEELLELYAFFKQANEGDNNVDKPSLLDLKGKKKWESWRSKKGITKEDAQKFYVNHVETLISKYS